MGTNVSRRASKSNSLTDQRGSIHDLEKSNTNPIQNQLSTQRRVTLENFAHIADKGSKTSLPTPKNNPIKIKPKEFNYIPSEGKVTPINDKDQVKDKKKLKSRFTIFENKKEKPNFENEGADLEISSSGSKSSKERKIYSTSLLKKKAYFDALFDELRKKEISEFFILDSIVLIKAYVGSDNWIKLFEIIASELMISIGYENSYNLSQKIRIMKFEDINILNTEMNRFARMTEIKSVTFAPIIDLQIRINRKKTVYYLFIVQPFYSKSLEKLVKGRYKFSDKEVFVLIQDGVNCLNLLFENNIEHGSITPKNIMIKWEGDKIRFVIESRTSSSPTKHLDYYSLGLCFLAAVTMQTYESLSFLSYSVISQMIESLAQPYFQLLDLFINPNQIPIKFIHKITQSIKLYSTQKFKLKRIWEKNYLLHCILGTKILVFDFQKSQICFISCKHPVFFNLMRVIILSKGVYIFYKKKTGNFISFHSLSTLDIYQENEINIELNEYISMPAKYEAAATVLFDQKIYMFGGQYDGFPTSTCYCINSNELIEIKELSFASLNGCAFIRDSLITFVHFGKYSGNIEHFNPDDGHWTREKAQSYSIKMIANSFHVDLKYDILGVSENEAFIIKDQLIHLKFYDDETKEIVQNFDLESNSKLNVVCIAEGLYASLRRNKSQGALEIVYFFINSFEGSVLASKSGLESVCKPKNFKEFKVPMQEDIIENNVIYRSDSEKVSIVENSENSNHYVMRTRKIERFKESFDDFFSSSRLQFSFHSHCLLSPKYITLLSDNESNDIFFQFYYEGNWQTIEKTTELRSKMYHEHEIIQFISKINCSLEYLRQRGFYFQTLSKSNIFYSPSSNQFYLLGFEHESRFGNENLLSNIHKQNMNSLAIIALNFISGKESTDDDVLSPLSSIFKQIILPILNKNEDECPNSFEYMLFLKKAKNKKRIELFFFKSLSPFQNFNNCSVGTENNDRIYLLSESGEMKLIGNLEGSYSIYNCQKEVLSVFNQESIVIYNSQIEMEKSIELPRNGCNWFNAISFGEMVLLIGGEREGIYGRVFCNEIFNLNSEGKFQKLENFPISSIEGRLQIFVIDGNIYALGHSSTQGISAIGSIHFQGESLLFQKWKFTKISWKERIHSQNIFAFIGPHNTILIVGALDSQGILFSLESQKTISIDLSWQSHGCTFEDQSKLELGNGVTWDGNVSRVLAKSTKGNKGIYILTSKVNLSKSSALILVKST